MSGDSVGDSSKTILKPRSGALELDDRVRLLMLGIVNLLLLILVFFSLGGVEFSTKGGSTSLAPMSFADIQVFVRVAAIGAIAALASSVWDWRYRLLSLLLWASIWTVNRRNEDLVDTARRYQSNTVPPVGTRQILLLRLLLAAMTLALAALVIQTGGWTISPYTQYGVTVFLLSMLLTDIFLGRVSLAVLGLCWIGIVFNIGTLDDYRYAVSDAVLGRLTFINFVLQLIAVAMASETFELGGLLKRRQGSGSK